MTVKLVLLKSGEDIISDVTEMIVGEEGLDSMPGEYLANLMETLDKYPEYHDILADIINDTGLDTIE